MKSFWFPIALALLRTATTHTVYTALFIDDEDQGDGTCVRMPMIPNNCTNPIKDLTSSDMACGFGGTTGVARVCSVNASSTLSVLFREYADPTYANGTDPGSIDPSHKGPCTVYIKYAKSTINDTAIGDGWFKIWDEGYDSITSPWYSEKLIVNKGFLSVDVPSDLAGGYYLLRLELISLHEANETPPIPQFHVGCAQIFQDSPETALPANTVSIPGYINISNPSVRFNIYTPQWPYPMVGPEPYINGTSSSTEAIQPVQKQTEGLFPSNAILINANWWGVELDSYSNSNGCWNASKVCFEQLTACYATAPPTGSGNCHIWDDKCGGIQSACNASNFSGPPNQGANLNPTTTTTYQSTALVIPETDGVYSNTVSVTYYPVRPLDRLYSTVVSVATVAPPTSTEVFLTEAGLPNTSTSSTNVLFTDAFEELATIGLVPVTSPMVIGSLSTSISSIDAITTSPITTYPSNTILSTTDTTNISSSVPSSLITSLSNTDTEDISSLLTGPSSTSLATSAAPTSTDLALTTAGISVTTSSSTRFSSTGIEDINSSVTNYLSTGLATAGTVATSLPTIGISTAMNLVTVKTSTTVSTTLHFDVPATTIATKVVIEYPLITASSALSGLNSIPSTEVASTTSRPAPIYINPSINGQCGNLYNQTCHGSDYGYCCSQDGLCGDDINYCGIGCQAACGNCSVSGSVHRKSKPRDFRNHHLRRHRHAQES